MLDSLSSRLAHARSLSGLSAKALDRLSGLTPGHVSAIESEVKKEVGAATVAKIATALGISLDWLVSGKDPAPTERAIRRAVSRSAAA